MILFFDTETTGVPKNYQAPITDLENWPRLVQLGWVCCLNDGTVIEEREFVIRPVGFEIPVEASNIHGVTQEIARRDGQGLKKVLKEFESRVSFTDLLVGHNVEFDLNVLGAEYLRVRMSTTLGSRPKVCTMKASTRYCNIPGPYGPKWPKLTELHVKLFGENLSQSHTALDDIQNTVKCYFEMKRLKIIE